MNDTKTNRAKLAREIRKYAKSFRAKTLTLNYNVEELAKILAEVRRNYIARANLELMGISGTIPNILSRPPNNYL